MNIRRAVSLAVLSLLGACSSPHIEGRAGRDATDAAADLSVRAAIETTWRAHIAAAVAKDFEGVLAIYAEDMLYVIPGVQEVHGLAGMRRMEAASLAEADVLHATHTIDELAVYGDIAYELGSVVGPVRPKGGEAVVYTFHFMAQWRRGVDGVWRMASMIGQG